MAARRIRFGRRPRQVGAVAIVVTTSLALLLTPTGAQAQAPTPSQPPAADPEPLADFDTRLGTRGLAPTATQLDLVERLDATARWTRFGTPQSLIRHGEFLATGIPGAKPVAAARAWLDGNRALYRLGSVDDLEVHSSVPLTGDAHVVVFRQRIGGLLVAPEGLASIGLVGSADGWSVAYASSTLVGEQPLAGRTALTNRDALAAAAQDVETAVDSEDIAGAGVQAGWRVLEAAGIEPEQLVRTVAFPTLTDGVRPAYETVFFESPEAGYRSFVDAQTGEVLYRESVVDQVDEDPSWEVYPARPPTALSRPPWNYPSQDQRSRWCWTDTPQCDLVLDDGRAPVPWDVDPLTGLPTFTTTGNAVTAFESWTGEVGQQPVSEERRYDFPWTNVWYESGCDSGNLVPGGNEIDAAVTNLFAGNWRMHDFAYHLGFTEETWNGQASNFGINPAGEGDPVLARAQAGAITPGSRNNASMGTRPDGTSSIMSMFLWQPAANSFYGPCVAGDFDMSVIGHEYTHMIENRMIGKGNTRSGFHAGAMGESWADFISGEYLNAYRFASGGPTQRWTTGAYVTGNLDRGIRNFNMADPPAGQFPRPGRDVQIGALNFGSMGYDIVGPQVHADSQIWSATNHDLRSLLLKRYPSTSKKRDLECADGLRPADRCPGNRRWIQIVFDAMLLMPAAPTMLDARDAYLAADLMRFGGANQDLLWLGFARRGFGEHASVDGVDDTDPVPSFESPLHEEATLRFEAYAQDEAGQPVPAEVFVGDYEARATPVQAVERFVPNPEGYNFIARADGYGHARFFVDKLRARKDRTITIGLPTNLASGSQGAIAAGDGFRLPDLIDDTEDTNWQSAPLQPNVVTVDPPSPAAGQYLAAGAAFGPPPAEDGLAGDIVLVDDGSDNPTEGCGPLVGFPAGAIALIDRGNCPFTQKVGNAQAAGASAVIVANNEPGAPSEMGGNDTTIVIPSVMVSQEDGATIRAGLPATGTVAAVPSVPVEGVQVTVALAGAQTFRLAKVSAMLLPGQNRFTALRQFELYACTAGDPDNPTCDGTTDAGWNRFLHSGPDAFPAPNPRPSAPDLAIRSFGIPPTSATHVKLVVVANQCTGSPHFQGDQHADPAAPTSDCRSARVGTSEVRAAELQLLTSRPHVTGARLYD